ncbi:DUF982 domain-containing protein [Phyllobacterium sp. SB3]|uniref:DUF982 domain-containing protein n=1 Tax=Phyllobacterium sp. SB3 TaxID=3156073 RepID=UPI0032AFA9F1
MKENFFKTPVFVLVGLGLPANIRSVMEAYKLLNDWPVHNRDTSHTLALNACKGVLTEAIETETARGLFVAFAKKHDLLTPELSPAIEYRRGGRSLYVV